MSKTILMVVVCFMALVQSPVTATAIDCGEILQSMLLCSAYLPGHLPLKPGTQCCDVASTIASVGGIDSLGQCLKSSPLGPGFLPAKAEKLVDLCNLSGVITLAKCFLPPNYQVPIPKVIPIPPGGDSYEWRHGW